MAIPTSILLTGASGFVGGHLSAALHTAFPEAKLVTTTFDLRDLEAVERIVRETKPTACFHLAAISAIPDARKDPSAAWQINLIATLGLAESILRHAPDAQMLFPSSADAYGASFRNAARLDESAPLAPQNTYAATKAAADLALGAMAADGLKVVRLRPFNHTGAGQSAAFVLPSFARQIARICAGLQEPAIEVGNLEVRRDFLDVRDVCDAYVACFAKRESIEPGLTLNIASGTGRRIGDILQMLCYIAGVKPEIRQTASRMRPSDIQLSVGDATRARNLLGWAPQIPWDKTLSDVLDDWHLRVRLDSKA